MNDYERDLIDLAKTITVPPQIVEMWVLRVPSDQAYDRERRKALALYDAEYRMDVARKMLGRTKPD